LDYAGGPDVITKVLVRRRQETRVSRRTGDDRIQKFEWCKEGSMDKAHRSF